MEVDMGQSYHPKAFLQFILLGREMKILAFKRA